MVYTRHLGKQNILFVGIRMLCDFVTKAREHFEAIRARVLNSYGYILLFIAIRPRRRRRRARKVEVAWTEGKFLGLRLSGSGVDFENKSWSQRFCIGAF